MNREDYKKARDSISFEERRAFSKIVCHAIIDTREYKNARRLMAYWAIGSELSLECLISHALDSGRELYLPVCARDGSMEGARLTGEDKLARGACGVPEPAGEIAAPEELDLIIAPMLAFNSKCFRIGWGRGYYDRYLIRTQAKRLGAAFSCQLDEGLMVKPHDVRLDKIITETRVWIPGD